MKNKLKIFLSIISIFIIGMVIYILVKNSDNDTSTLNNPKMLGFQINDPTIPWATPTSYRYMYQDKNGNTGSWSDTLQNISDNVKSNPIIQLKTNPNYSIKVQRSVGLNSKDFKTITIQLDNTGKFTDIDNPNKPSGKCLDSGNPFGSDNKCAKPCCHYTCFNDSTGSYFCSSTQCTGDVPEPKCCPDCGACNNLCNPTPPPKGKCEPGGSVYNTKTTGDGNPTCGQRYEYEKTQGGGWKEVICDSPNSNAGTVCRACYDGTCDHPPPTSNYVLNIPDQKLDNYLKIDVNNKNPENNYFIILGDWGAGGFSASCINAQKQVAKAMLDFYNNQKSKGKNLLCIITVGDNFYDTGLSSLDNFKSQWKDIYGELATDHIWFAIMGNHDWGNADSSCLCPDNDPNAKNIKGQYYKCNQLNTDKGGIRPPGIGIKGGYHMPDFAYNYRIDDLDFELIGISNSVVDCPGGIGGGGEGGGATQTFGKCGSPQKACDKLRSIHNAGIKLIQDRAQNSKAKNILIFNHYPGSACDELRQTFISKSTVPNQTVICAGGHTHSQGCLKTDYNGMGCLSIQSGGGGGCCPTTCQNPDPNIFGFYVGEFDSNKNLVTYNVSSGGKLGNYKPIHVPHPPDGH
jgi:hypothetical protein